MVTKVFTHEKNNFWLMIQNAIPGTYGKVLRLLGNDPVACRVGWLLFSWPSPSPLILCCVSP